MSAAPRILLFAGSARAASLNRKLASIAAQGVRDAGGEATVIDLKDFPLPLFDQDLESASGLPEPAQRLKQLFIEHHGLLIASPEYNSSVTPLLKNTIDWVSRPVAGEPPLRGFQGKVAGLVSASPGGLGGLRGLVHLRSILGNIGVIVLPEQVAVSKANEAFADDGTLKDPKQQAGVQEIGRKLVTTARKLLA